MSLNYRSKRFSRKNENIRFSRKNSKPSRRFSNRLKESIIDSSCISSSHNTAEIGFTVDFFVGEDIMAHDVFDVDIQVTSDYDNIGDWYYEICGFESKEEAEEWIDRYKDDIISKISEYVATEASVPEMSERDLLDTCDVPYGIM